MFAVDLRDHDDTPVEDEIVVLRGLSWSDYQRQLELEFSPYGSWTLEDKQAERGVEADECYVFGVEPEAARPHLAIEVVWTSQAMREYRAALTQAEP